jgi:hypothetical protein
LVGRDSVEPKKVSDAALFQAMARQSLALPFHDGSQTSLFRSRDENSFEFSRDLARFRYVYAKGNARLALLGKPISKRSPLFRIWAQAERDNLLAHGSQKSNRAFRDDDVNGRLLPKLEPEEAISSQCGHGVDASAERSTEMIRVQRNWRLENESAFIVRHNPDAHRERDRNLLMEILLGFAKRGRIDHNRTLAQHRATVECELGGRSSC